MTSNRDLLQDTGTDQHLGEFLPATVRYVPLLTSLLALGLLGIYALARAGFLGAPAWQVYAAAGVSLAVGLPQMLIRGLVRRGREVAALWVFWALMGIWAVSVVLLWNAVAPVGVLMAWVAFVVALAARVRGRRLAILAAASAILSLCILWINTHPWFDRLTTANAAGLAALIVVVSTVILFVLGTVVVRLFRYRSVQGRLVTALTLIMAVPVLFTTGIAAITASTNSQSQFRDSLQAVASLKLDQIDATLQTVQREMSPLQDGSGRAASLVGVLDPASQTPANYSLNVAQARTLLHSLTAQYPASQYEEILVLDKLGRVMLSTHAPDETADFNRQSFFREGSKRFYAELVRFPSGLNTDRRYKLVAAEPLYGNDQQDVRGVVLAVINGDLVLQAMGPSAALTGARTYLVDQNRDLVSNDTANPVAIIAWPIVHSIISEESQGSQTYNNYQGQSTFGYVVWDPTVNAAIVSEISNSAVYNKALASVLISGLVGLFAIVIAGIAALSTAGAISEPISALARAAKTLSTGDLSVRAPTDQRDEVGNLAESFNAMAGQLQGIIGNLEQRIEERTQALAQQSLRLRTAAEVARDAASAANLDELLDQAARLIMERFGFYHSGIFLVDEKGEYAVLRASPSQAGRKMLENQHRLRVGEQGIVGRVAATGEPRIALDTGVDPVYFSNPLLPNTHSEMALPLKTVEGTIGVIDIQSDQPEAFTQDDIAIVQVMADQLATAIQRTNLLQQVRSQLQQLEQTYQGFTEQAWRTFGRAGRQNIGYKFDNIRLESIKSVPEELRPALEADGPQVEDAAGRTLQVPIRLRGQVIGIVQLRFQAGRVSAATTSMIQQIADRLATALENARLLDDSLRRANKERAIGEITAKISASMNMRNVLQTAVEELGRAIPGSDVVIQFRPDTEL